MKPIMTNTGKQTLAVKAKTVRPAPVKGQSKNTAIFHATKGKKGGI